MFEPERASFLTLPDELVEEILIACAANNDVVSVATIAATSRRFYSTIYEASDHRLWRSLFLVLFDDPRDIDGRPSQDINWRQKLQDRVWTHRFFSEGVQPILTQRLRGSPSGAQVIHPPLTADESLHPRALNCIIEVLYTPAPSPLSVDAARELSRAQATPSSKALAPLWTLDRAAFQRPSLNVAWLIETLSTGLPASITTRISRDEFASARTWSVGPEGLATGRIISHLGFLPIPTKESEVDSQEEMIAPEIQPRFLDASAQTDILLALDDMTEETQRKRAHWHARQRTFDMGYLAPYRHWGPYLPVRPPVAATTNTANTGGYSGEYSEEFGDPDWMPGTEMALPTHLPLPDQLRPDWSWLAAARIVAESTLREEQQDDLLRELSAWDNIRGNTWGAPLGDDEPSTEGSGRPRPAGFFASETVSNIPDGGGEYPGYDWAGAEGTWRRLVIWLGYDDLVDHYQRGHYDDSDLEEVYVVTLMSLRITGYSPSPVAAYADRPTIHVEGEMGGPGRVGNVLLLEAPILRRGYGSVSMLADGSVRWSFTSRDEDDTHDQWASEMIQLGGVGSAMGALGMWTGADHESDDPLGVIWQWRVG